MLCEMSSCKKAQHKLLHSTQLLFRQQNVVFGASYCGGNEIHQATHSTSPNSLKFPFDAHRYHWVLGDPLMCHAFCAAVLFKGKLYVSGGRNIHRHTDCASDAVNDIWRYNRNEGKWSSVGAMSYCRIHHTAVVFQDSVYFIGGLDDRLHMLSSVERLNINRKTVTIEPVKTMSIARAGTAAAGHGNLLFVAGGISKKPSGSGGGHILDLMECFDPTSNRWQRLVNIGIPRAFATMISTNLGLYIIGGVTPTNQVEKSLESIRSIAEVEVYGRKNNEPYQGLNMPRYAASIAVHDCHLYVFGGIELETGNYVTIVERFSATNKSWVIANDKFSTQLKKS